MNFLRVESSRGAGATLLAILALAMVSPTVTLADGPQPLPTFAQVVGASRLVVLATVTGRPATGETLRVERVLKGRAKSVLHFGPDNANAIEQGWSRAIVAFTDPSSIDFRTPTYAWHVAADGSVDPERYQQYPGTPQTLARWFAWFEQPPATDAASAPAGSGPASMPSLVALALAAAGGAAIALHRRHRGRAP